MSPRCALASLAALGIAVALAACTSASPSSRPAGSVTPSSSTPEATAGPSPEPGVVDRGNGAVEAYGWVARVDLEGGFWALVRQRPATGSKVDVVIVLVPGQTGEAKVAALEGSYVRVSGMALHGASIRMAGPEMEVGSIEALPAP